MTDILAVLEYHYVYFMAPINEHMPQSKSWTFYDDGTYTIRIHSALQERVFTGKLYRKRRERLSKIIDDIIDGYQTNAVCDDDVYCMSTDTDFSTLKVPSLNDDFFLEWSCTDVPRRVQPLVQLASSLFYQSKLGKQ